MREGEKKSSRKVVRLFQKRWVFPTLYIVCAAVILTAALWYQAVGDKKAPAPTKPNAPIGQKQNPTVPVAKTSEIIKMPVAKSDQVTVKKKFYEDKASAQEQEQALVFYNNTYSANTGVDIAAKDGKTFDVTASISGTVTKAEKDPLLGYVVTVDNGNGISTFYQSLEEVKVEVGDTVAQGNVVGKAGMSEVNKEAGYHVHFEIRKDNVAVNPESFFEKSVADIKVEAKDSKKDKQQAPAKQDSKKPAGQEKNDSSSDKPAKDDKQQKEDATKSSSPDQNEENSNN